MNPFKTYSFTWWQIGILKLALLSIGILIGSLWSGFWNNFTTALIVVAVIASAYSLYAGFKQ